MTDLECAEFVELATGYLDGALDAETELRFVAHLPVCTGCERYLAQVRLTVRMLRRLDPQA